MSSHSRKRQMTTYGELSIYIDDSYIFIRLLPGDSFCERYKIHLADVVHQNFSGCTGDVAHCIFNHELSLFGFNRIVFHKQFLLIWLKYKKVAYHEVIFRKKIIHKNCFFNKEKLKNGANDDRIILWYIKTIKRWDNAKVDLCRLRLNRRFRDERYE